MHLIRTGSFLAKLYIKKNNIYKYIYGRYYGELLFEMQEKAKNQRCETNKVKEWA